MNWTKTDRKRAWTALNGWRLCHGSVSQPAEIPDDPAVQALAAIWDLTILCGIYEERAISDEMAARHFEAHPNVYGENTPEMIERFDNLAIETRKSIVKLQKLIARIEANGMPPKPDDYRS